jgi:probable F420-dependent oxidoreductase
VKIGLYLLPLEGPGEALAAVARGAEARGLHSLWVPEPHLLIFDSYSSVFPYSPDGKLPEEYGTQGELDGLLALAYLAGETETIRLGIGVCIVPQRNPVYTAKDVTTLDQLSQGRFDLGIGIGWLKEEFDGVGAAWDDRAKRCREYIQVMKSLWHDPMSSFSGQFFSLPESHQEPRPIQKPHPPIHFGGNSRAALTRVADLGQGWIPWDLTPDQARAGIDQLVLLLEERGRSRDEIQVSVAVEITENGIDVRAYEQAGVDQLVVVAPMTPRTPSEAEETVEAVLAAAGDRTGAH